MLRTGVRVEGAERGFNPHHPKDRSSYSLTAHLAQTSKLLAVENRLGNAHDSEGHYEYSAVATNEGVRLRTLWDFVAGRGGHEKTLCELKQHLAFDTIPTQDRDANSTWLLISAIKHNVVPEFQLATGSASRRNGAKRTYRWVLESLRTLRYELLNVPAKIAKPQGRPELRIAAAPETQRRITQVLTALPEAA